MNGRKQDINIDEDADIALQVEILNGKSGDAVANVDFDTPEETADGDETATVAAEEPASPATAATAASQSGANVLYSVLMLMMRSRQHRHMFISDLEWSIIPPLALQQFHLFQNDKGPIGYVTWAVLSEEVVNELPTRQGRLKSAEWRSRQDCWIVDLVAPFGGRRQMIEQLQGDVLQDNIFRYVRFDAVSGQRFIETIQGINK